MEALCLSFPGGVAFLWALVLAGAELCGWGSPGQFVHFGWG